MPPIHSQPIVDLTSDANTIQNRFVGDSSATGYLRKLVQIALWLFENSIDVFTTSALTSVREAHAKDQAKTNPQKRTCLWKKLKELFSQTEPNNDGTNTCPIKLHGEGALSWDNVQTYTVTLKRTVKVNKKLANQYKRGGGGNTTANESMPPQNNNGGDDEEVVDALLYQSVSPA